MLLLLVTCPDKKCADKIARMLVERHHAACVSIIPILKSVYLWEGKIHEHEEYLLHIKTKKPFLFMEEMIKRLHPDKVPQIISVKVEKENMGYLNWVTDCCRVHR